MIPGPFEIEAFTKFTFTGRGKKYSAFEWTSRCFSGVDYADDIKENGIFRIENGYGDSFEKMVGHEKGNYDYLMSSDIDFRNPAVDEELLKWGTIATLFEKIEAYHPGLSLPKRIMKYKLLYSTRDNSIKSGSERYELSGQDLTIVHAAEESVPT